MAIRDYEVIFVGGGLAAMLLLRELGPALSGRVAVLDEELPPRQLAAVFGSALPAVLGKP